MAKYLDDNGLLYLWTKIKAAFVAKESGKGLSTNDYTSAEKNKLSGIESGAEVNVIETVKVNGSALTPSSKAVNIDLSNYATKSDIGSVYKYKGTVNTYADLPSTGQSVGDTYNVETADSTHGIKAGDNVSWNGSDWDVLSGTIDLSGYATTSAMNTALAGKVDKVTGKQLSTEDYTSAEKTKLSGIASGAEVNVQADWNVTDSSSDAYIKNKPTIPSGVTVDSALSSTSTNPVQNKVINSALNGKAASSHTHTVSQITDLAAITNAEIDTIVAS